MQRHHKHPARLGRSNLYAYAIRNNLIGILGRESYEKNCRCLARAVASLMEVSERRKLNWHINHFWVVKEAPGKHKGDIVFAREHSDLLKRQKESKFRDIFCFGKDARQACRGVITALEPFNKIPTQFGFKEHLGVHNAFASVYDGGEFRFYVDLQNAFCQITRRQIYWLFHKSLDLSRPKSNWLADRMCDSSGHLFQGNPLAPVIFNLLSSTLNKVLNKLLKPHGIKVSQYADDITFSSNSHISLSMRKWIVRLVNLCGWQANLEKCEYKKKNAPFKQTLGIVEIRGRGIFAVKQRRMRKLLSYIKHIRKKYKTTLWKTPRGNKLIQLEKGFASWLSLMSKLANPTLRDSYYNTKIMSWQIFSAVQLTLF